MCRLDTSRVCWPQVMSKAQLPLLTSVIMVTQAFISAPAGLRAKRSLKDRNQVLLLGYAAMIAADLTFAFMPTVYGGPPAHHAVWLHNCKHVDLTLSHANSVW